MKTVVSTVEVAHVGGQSLRVHVTGCSSSAIARLVVGAFASFTVNTAAAYTTHISPGVGCIVTEISQPDLTPGPIAGRMITLLGRAITLAGRGLVYAG